MLSMAHSVYDLYRTHTAKRYYTRLLSDVLRTIEPGSTMIVGPLQIGTEHYTANVEAFTHARETLEARGEKVFNQIPYLDIYDRKAPHNYNVKFDIFYRGVIQSGRIAKLYVLPHSEHSPGTIKEIAFATEAGIPIIYDQNGIA